MPKKKQKVLTPDQQRKAWLQKNIRRLKQGWELHVWRMSSPHNVWIEGRRGNSTEYFDRGDIGWDLVNYVKQHEHFFRYDSVKRVPEYRLISRGSDCGQPQHTIWRSR